MKLVALSLVACCSHVSAQVLDLSVADLRNISAVEKGVIKSYLNTGDRAVYLYSKESDFALFALINDYRLSKGIKPLGHLQRLDTLANIVARKNAEIGRIAHYNQIPELKSIYDLLNIENIAHHYSGGFLNRSSFARDGNSTDVVDLEELLRGWIESPKHNRNLLFDLDVGTAKILVKVTKDESRYVIDTYAVFENDYSYSKRDLDEKYRKVNEWLLHRKIKFQKRQ